MINRLSSEQKQALRKRLQREAAESWPDYSETLHRRILAAVKRRRAEELPRRLPAASRRSGRWAAVLAAACLLGAVAIGWRPTARISPQNSTDQDALAATGDPLNFLTPKVVEATGVDLSLLDELAAGSVDDLDHRILSAAVAWSPRRCSNGSRSTWICSPGRNVRSILIQNGTRITPASRVFRRRHRWVERCRASKVRRARRPAPRPRPSPDRPPPGQRPACRRDAAGPRRSAFA
jgi:hypothetical protein